MSKIKGFIGETLVYGLGNVFSKVFAMLLIPLYAQYLGKIDYSNLIMLQSVFTILTFLLALNSGVFYYYYEYNNLKYRKIIFTSWFYYQQALTVVLLITAFFTAPYLVNYFIIADGNEYDIYLSLILIVIQLFPYNFNITNLNYYRIERKPKLSILIVLLEAFFTLALTYLVFTFFDMRLVGVMLCQIVARSIVSVIYVRCARLYIDFRKFSKKLVKKMLIFTWPFIMATIFSWFIVSVDKFIGAQALLDKSNVALLALAMQLVLPVTVLADMIRMALGPYVMSIRKDSDADQSYQKIFDLSMYASSLVLIGIILISPFLTILLTDETYMNVIYVVPLMGLANVIALAANQFCVGFSLVKKTTYVLYGFIISGGLSIMINWLFMQYFGFVVSGYSQIFAYLAMTIFLFFTGRKVANLNINVTNSLILIGIVTLYITGLQFINPFIIKGNYDIMVLSGFLCLILISFVYFKQQKLNPIMILKSIIQKPK